MSEILNNQYTDLFGFKQTKTFDGEDVVYYRLIGANLLFIHDKFDETVQVMDDELDSDEHSVVMHQSEFFESYAGYHMGTDDVTIDRPDKDAEIGFALDEDYNALVKKIET